MINEYNEIFQDYKNYIVENSNFSPRVVKDYTSTSTHFPIISCQLSNIVDTDYCTLDMIEKYEEMYLTIDIYTKNKTINNNEVASQLINDELTNLTIEFFNSIKMKRTLCRLTPNLDTSITRRTIQYQALVSTYRKNIIRR